MSDRQEERECVLRLLTMRGLQQAHAESKDPPAPDVLVTFADGSREAFEVTLIHPDEVPGQGSAARAAEERRSRRVPNSIASISIRLDAVPTIRHRIEEKVKKAAGYAIRSNETLSLLLVGSLPKIGAVAATYVFSSSVTVEQLNTEFNALLENSRFQQAYLHLALG